MENIFCVFSLSNKTFIYHHSLISNQILLFSGVKPVSLLANPQFVRAWPGGTGYAKMGSNYAPTLYAQQLAESVGCQQCLWLFGPDEELTEVGTMNIFALIRKESSPGGKRDGVYNIKSRNGI